MESLGPCQRRYGAAFLSDEKVVTSNEAAVVKTNIFAQLVVVLATCGVLAVSVGACSAERNNNSFSIIGSGGATAPGEELSGAPGLGNTNKAVGAGGGISLETGNAGKKICAKKDVVATRKPINMILIVDRSTTMGITLFGLNNRWGALRVALLEEPDGLVPSYQSTIRFGFEGFTGFPPDDCPNLVSVPHALNNYQKILQVYDDFGTVPSLSPLGQTPTGEALKVIVDKLEPLVKTKLDVNADPFYMLLATDGLPDTCSVPNAEDDPATYPEAQKSTIDQIKRAYNLGIKSYVLSVGDDVSSAHLQAVANAGVGATGAPFWKVGDDKGLRDALSAIIGAASSCQLQLEGSLTNATKACQSGSVMLNSKQLSCNDQDGWRVVNATVIELVGPSCTTYKNNLKAALNVSFPCDVIVLQ
jgi:hypothetical protein